MPDLEKAADAYREFLKALGVDRYLHADIEDCGMRVASLMARRLCAQDGDAPKLSLMPAPNRDKVVLGQLPFYSFCGHHFVPFFGTAAIEFVPRRSIAGLGGFVRIIDYFSRRPQFQENLTAQIADCIFDQLAPESVCVTVCARQMCLELQGCGSNIEITTQAVRADKSETASESAKSRTCC